VKLGSAMGDVLSARASTVKSQIHDAMAAVTAGDPTSAIGRFEEKIRRDEATVRGQKELDSSSLESQFASLEDLGEQTEVEARSPR
jgi:phage shock protein A